MLVRPFKPAYGGPSSKKCSLESVEQFVAAWFGQVGFGLDFLEREK
jgi:hypothetical protein